MEVGETSIVSKPVFSQGYAINRSLSGAPIWSGFGPKIRVALHFFLPSALEMKNFLKLRNQFGFCFFFPFFFQILWMRGKFTAFLLHDTNLFTVHIKKVVIRNQEEGANLDGEDDNFSTYTHKYLFLFLK